MTKMCIVCEESPAHKGQTKCGRCRLTEKRALEKKLSAEQQQENERWAFLYKPWNSGVSYE